MASILDKALESLTLDPDHLLFNPTGEMAWIQGTFKDTPPYLFRVFTPNSAGQTDEHWTRSMDAKLDEKHHRVDIFAREDKHSVAEMINNHLRWRHNGSINLVSWTSSLLFALEYIFHLHKNPTDGSSLGDIKLCIIDTRVFPEGCFVRDMDLVEAYKPFHNVPNYYKNLTGFASMRNRQHRDYKGWYYFGEYLSQGSLKIEGKCQIVSAADMIFQGLFELQPALRGYQTWKTADKPPPWANEVLRLREVFYTSAEIPEVTYEELSASMSVASLFGMHFRVPIAASLLALVPRRADNLLIQVAFKTAATDEEREDCSCFEAMVHTEKLPEVDQFRNIMKTIYDGFCKDNEKAKDAKKLLDTIVGQLENISLALERFGKIMEECRELLE